MIKIKNDIKSTYNMKNMVNYSVPILSIKHDTTILDEKENLSHLFQIYFLNINSVNYIKIH